MTVFAQTSPRSFREKLYEINWAFVLLVLLVGMIGVGMLYSIGGGNWEPWAIRHATRLGVGLSIMLFVAIFPPRFWLGVAYPSYALALLLLVGVEMAGVTVMGAQRWLDLGPIRIQPSEVMKVALVLALARYYHDLDNDKVSSLGGLIPAAVIIGVPMLLVLRQPDLGTAVLIGATGAAIIFLAGLSWRVVLGAAVTAVIGGIVFLRYGLEDYQRARIATFLNPEADPLGAGYNISQSKIALGSGGLTGRGFMEGTQSQLNYLPEHQTDFIFTTLGEEFGFVGGLAVMALYFLILANCLLIAVSCRSQFMRLLVMGITTTFALYVFINIAMVMGVVPVVGVPLPMISYGGTVMLAVLAGLGLVLGAHIHRGAEVPKGTGILG